MESCEEVGKRVDELAALEATAMPSWAMDHLAGCPDCTRLLMRAHLAHGLLASVKDGQEPPADFARRVLAALPDSRPAGATDPELWRLAWRLVPAFAATLAMLLILFQFEGGVGSVSVTPVPGVAQGLLSEEGLSASESLAFGVSPPDLDLVLTAVMERDST
jgi:hypothetical protein